MTGLDPQQRLLLQQLGVQRVGRPGVVQVLWLGQLHPAALEEGPDEVDLELERMSGDQGWHSACHVCKTDAGNPC